MTRERYTKQSWLELGLQVLAKTGPNGLTIETLCERAQKTRGSFYFHFESINGFLESLADEWHQRFNEQIIANGPTKSSRRDLLNELAGRLDPAIETGIRQLAISNTEVQKRVTIADKERIAWLAKLYSTSGHYDGDKSSELATLEYAAFIGFRLVEPEMDTARSKALYQAFLEFTGRA